MQGVWLSKAFVSSDGIGNLSMTSLSVDNFNHRALWCKPTGINYNMHGWILCRYCATGWFWWISGLRVVLMWSSSSYTKSGNHKSNPVVTINNSGARQVALLIKHVIAWHSINSAENAAVGIISQFSINVVLGGAPVNTNQFHSDSLSGVNEGVMT